MEIIVMMLVSALIALGLSMAVVSWTMNKFLDDFYDDITDKAKNSLSRDAGLAINIDANTRNIHIIAKALNIDKYTEKRQEKASDAIKLTADDVESDDWPTSSIRDETNG